MNLSIIKFKVMRDINRIKMISLYLVLDLSWIKIITLFKKHCLSGLDIFYYIQFRIKIYQFFKVIQINFIISLI